MTKNIISLLIAVLLGLVWGIVKIMKLTGIKETAASPTSGYYNKWVCPNCKYKHNPPHFSSFKWNTTKACCERCGELIKLTNPTPHI